MKLTNLQDLSLCDSIFYLLFAAVQDFNNMTHVHPLLALFLAMQKTNVIKDLSQFWRKCLYRKTYYAKKILNLIDLEMFGSRKYPYPHRGKWKFKSGGGSKFQEIPEGRGLYDLFSFQRSFNSIQI